VLGEDLAAELPRLRAEAESAMTDHGVIGTLESDLDRETGEIVETVVPAYTGRLGCRQSEDRQRVESAGSEVTASPVTVRAPWDTPVQPGMVVVFDASADPRLLGVRLRVSAVKGGTWSVQRRIICEEVQGADQDQR
jgi:hypothetical protein